MSSNVRGFLNSMSVDRMMRSLSTACAVLMVCALAEAASPARAAPIVFNDVISGGPTGTRLTVGGTSSLTFTHDITAVFNPATDTIQNGTLTIVVSDPPPGRAEQAQIKFASGSFINLTPGGNIVANDSIDCSFQGTAFLLRIDPLKRLNRRSRAVPGNMDCR